MLLVYGLTNAATHGWGDTITLAALAGAAALLMVFLIVEARSSHPLMPFHIFRNRNRVGSSSGREDRSSHGANSDLIGTARPRIATVDAEVGLSGEIGRRVNPGFIEESLRDCDGHIRANSEIEGVARSAIEVLHSNV